MSRQFYIFPYRANGRHVGKLFVYAEDRESAEAKATTRLRDMAIAKRAELERREHAESVQVPDYELLPNHATECDREGITRHAPSGTGLFSVLTLEEVVAFHDDLQHDRTKTIIADVRQWLAQAEDSVVCPDLPKLPNKSALLRQAEDKLLSLELSGHLSR